jgi:hypothetical protein
MPNREDDIGSAPPSYNPMYNICPSEPDGIPVRPTVSVPPLSPLSHEAEMNITAATNSKIENNTHDLVFIFKPPCN